MALRDRLERAGRQQRGGSLAGAGALGVLSGLLVGPCMTAPLAAALLFIALTFAGFFLFEVLKRLAVHPVQYGLVGLSLAMFYLLLLSLAILVLVFLPQIRKRRDEVFTESDA